MFELCRNSGIQYFQGYYFARPESLADKSSQPGQLALLALLNKVRACEDLGEIEEPLPQSRPDPAPAAIRQFRRRGPAARPHRAPRTGPDGLKALYRWLALLLVTANPAIACLD